MIKYGASKELTWSLSKPHLFPVSLFYVRSTQHCLPLGGLRRVGAEELPDVVGRAGGHVVGVAGAHG